MSIVEPVLVTGATGFIGGHLAARLRSMGARPRLIVRDASGLRSDLRDSADIITGDMAASDRLRQAVRGAGTIFHCAANVNTWDRWPAYAAANIAGIGNLLDAIAAERATPARLVHLSSVDVYGFPSEAAAEAAPATGGAFLYGRSKAAGEAVLREKAARLGVPTVILRPTNVIGPGSQFIRRIGDELRRGLMLTIDGGRADCGFLYVQNLIDCMIWAATAPAAIGRCFNVRDPASIGWDRFVRDLREGIEGRGIVINLPFHLADAAAMLAELPWRARLLRGEPLLHRLLVRIFGRTCGHDISALRDAGAPVGGVGYEEAMRRSIGWYREITA
ncbi:MAG TPA: NAD(P)-dependent oxidoreductase [Acidiphilium sp.]|nr:NAD(P)-dependent oxidoreductase [Acidiphilium sp.]